MDSLHTSPSRVSYSAFVIILEKKMAAILYKYSLLMHRIKIKSPAFFLEWIKRFCGWIYHFSISLTLAVLQRQESLPDIGGTTIQDAISLS